MRNSQSQQKGHGNVIVTVEVYDPRDIPQKVRGQLNRINKYLET